jgi:hypothetical protein
MAQKKSTWKLILDGKVYRDGVLEEGLALATDICRSPKAGSRVIYGFTSPASFQRWARSQGLFPGCQKSVRIVEKAVQQGRRLKKTVRNRIEQSQVRVVRADNRKVRRVLARSRVKPKDTRALMKLSQKGVIGSIFLYDRTNYGGPFLHLPTAVPGPGSSYPRLSQYGWNDRAEAAINTGPFNVVLCQHSWFRGTRRWLAPGERDPDLGDFNNRTSSVLVA